jgi:hypothetical protein
MKYKINVAALVPSELLYAFDPDQESVFVAARERGLIVLRPINAPVESQCNINSDDYKKGYLIGANDGFHKGYTYAMAADKIMKLFAEDEDEFPDCTGFCKTCPHYDDLFDSCKYYT